MQDLLNELKSLIVDSLELDDVAADGIDVDAPLFSNGEGLGLDSIDALELAVALSKKYGLTLRADDEKTRDVFTNVRSLANHIVESRG
jgi:acyl carrier protein